MTQDGETPAAEPQQPAPPPAHPSQLGSGALKALAHPLRVRIIDLLSTHDALTATGLGELVGESSGSTSYHLRQLAKHGLVEEIVGRGTGRERWWRRPTGGFSIGLPTDENDVAARTAADLVNREFLSLRERRIEEFVQIADSLEPRWRDSSTFTTTSVWLTSDQLAEVTLALHAALDTVLAPFRDQASTPGARPVQIHVNTFPTADGRENPA